MNTHDVMNTLYNAGLITLEAVATSMVSRKLMSHGFDARSNEISGGSRRWIGTREIFTEDELRPRGTIQGPINGRCRGGRIVQRDSLCGSGLRVPHTGQERLRKRDEKARHGNGDPQRGEEVVREDRGEEQDSTSETEASGRKQGPGRRE